MINKRDNAIEILVVEDSPTQAEQLKYILEQRGYRTSVASNGKEALALMNKHKPKLVISDVVMPEMDGYELCQQVKTDENLKNIPVILLTVLSDPSDVIKGLKYKADHFVTKPYEENHLLACIRNILANWELRKKQEIDIGMEILIGDQKYFINADRLQILHLLISTYEAAVQQKQELIQARNELKRLNEHLEEKVEERSVFLNAEIIERICAEERLHESEGKLSAMLQSIGDHMSMMDKNLNIIWANETARKIFSNDIIGKKCYEVYHRRKEPCEPYPCLTLRAFQDGKVHEHDTQVIDKDGRIIYFHCTANVALRDKEGKPSAVIEISRDITERKIAEEKLLAYQKQLQSLASQLSLVEERERHRIATDLHDHISQTLALCKIKLGSLRKSASTDLAEPLDEIHKLIKKTIQYTRSLTSELSPPILYELGFEAAVEWLGEQILTRHGIQFYFENDGQNKPMDDEARILLFQAARELLVNIVKHAQAHNAKVSIRRDNDNIRINVEDDGVGFDISKLESYLMESRGFGLFSIRERVNRIRGYLNIESEPGKGTKATIIAPLKKG